MALAAPPGKGTWDPVVKYTAKYDAATEGTLTAGKSWLSPPYELAPDEVIEIFRLEIVPPVDPTTGTIKKIHATIVVDGKEYETLRIHSIMAPADSPLNAGIALDFGIPYLHTPIFGRLPGPLEAKCPKAKKGQKVQVKVTAIEDISQDFEVVMMFARARTADILASIVGVPFVSKTIILNGESFGMGVSVPISLDTWDELPGGLRQTKPEILPWAVWSTNKVATTPNVAYMFDYPMYVDEVWQELYWVLTEKPEAYILNALAVMPHTNSSKAEIWVDGRITTLIYPTLPLPKENYFFPPQYYETSTNNTLKKAGPRHIVPPFVFHGVKGGIRVYDNGTSIPAKGVEVYVWGTKVVLK